MKSLSRVCFRSILAGWSLALFGFILLTTTTNALVPPAVVHITCGFVAGSAGAIVAYPFDYVKSQLQTEYGRAKYSGGFEAAIDIMKTGGPFALFRGVLINIVGIAPEKTIKLGVNDAARMAIQSHFGYLPLVGEVLAGGLAGMTQVAVTNPLELVKVRLQTSDMGIKDVLSQINGFGDLYQGAGACVARDAVFSAILFPVYAHAKVAMAAYLITTFGGGGAVIFWANLAAGSCAAAPAAAIATPMDVVKTRLQQAREDRGEEGMIVDVEQQNGFHVLQTIVREEGTEVLMSGWLERVVRSVPQFGVTLAVFDVLYDMAVKYTV
jgi:solute carrier family 25 aspartate/glutamate transporter 12/13